MSIPKIKATGNHNARLNIIGVIAITDRLDEFKIFVALKISFFQIYCTLNS